MFESREKSLKKRLCIAFVIILLALCTEQPWPPKMTTDRQNFLTRQRFSVSKHNTAGGWCLSPQHRTDPYQGVHTASVSVDPQHRCRDRNKRTQIVLWWGSVTAGRELIFVSAETEPDKSAGVSGVSGFDKNRRPVRVKHVNKQNRTSPPAADITEHVVLGSYWSCQSERAARQAATRLIKRN